MGKCNHPYVEDSRCMICDNTYDTVRANQYYKFIGMHSTTEEYYLGNMVFGECIEYNVKKL